MWHNVDILDNRVVSGKILMGVSNTLKYTKVTPKGGKGFEFVKRAFDIVASAGALIVLALPIGVVALIIYRDDKGNPFFSLVRLTKDGKPFKMYKLRSMRIDAESRLPLPREVVLYTPEQMDRLLVKGGLSCICQTEGRSDIEFDKWVEGNVRYIKTQCGS